MKQVRQGVFETNSSSTHSITISDKEIYNDFVLEKDGKTLILTGGEFGWEEEDYSDCLSKANYIAIMLHELKNLVIRFKEYGEETYKLPEWADANYGQCYNIFMNVLKEGTGCKYIWIQNMNHSFIDHQSIEDITDNEWLLDSDKVKNFIFGRRSFLRTDNDNH